MIANVDFRQYICEAIRLNGWDDLEHPVTPESLNKDECQLHDLFINGKHFQYEITDDHFMLVNGLSCKFYTVDEKGELLLQPIPEPPVRNPNQGIINAPDRRGEMFITVAELLAKRDPVSWLITDWIPQGKGLIQMYGASGTGKSFLALDWMMSLITGQTEWQGNSCRFARCVYLCGEGQRGVAKRINAWLQHHGMSVEDCKETLGENGLVLSSSALLSLDIKDQLESMQNTLDRNGFIPDLVIVDTLNRFMQGNENDTRDATAFVHSCDELASKYNCVVLLIHHVGWSTDAQNRARGSSVVHSSVDMDFQLKECNGVLMLSQEKNKDYEKSQPIYMTLQGVQICMDDISESSAVLVSADKPEDEVKDVTRQNDEVICLEAFKAFGMEHNGVVTITIEDFKRHCKGKLTDRKGKPYDGNTFINQFNPNQGKFISRLLGYRVVEYTDENKRNRLRLTDTAMLFLYHSYKNQQPDLDSHSPVNNAYQ